MIVLSDAGVLDSLVQRLKRLSLTQRRMWGTMTPHQMLVHVAHDSEVVLSGCPVPRGPRPPSLVIKWIALRGPLKWPRGLQSSGVDVAGKDLPAEAFERDRERAIAALTALVSSAAGTLPPAHPAFGSMSHREWLRWAYLHTDHHLRQFGV